MTLTIAVRKETAAGEHRVAATPETVRKFVALGCDVVVEKGAGLGSQIPDDAFKAAGAAIAKDGASLYKSADIVLSVAAPELEDIAVMKKGAILMAHLGPFAADFADRQKLYAKQGIIAFSLEKMPRISRAQSMDVLSSQSNLAGYRAVIEAAYLYGKGFPMLMTAAGTVTPAKVFIMGVGVAGLQAIATARRLGGVVSATDVRAAAKEQVQSLGANFVMVDLGENNETSGGYARELTDDEKKKQAELIAETLPKMDIVITTALIPGRPAPVLVSKEMVASMKPGSVIVDMAAAQGGNCPLTKKDEVITTENGVQIAGYTNLPSRIAADSSALYAKNLLNFVSLMVKKGEKGPELAIPEDDQLIVETRV